MTAASSTVSAILRSSQALCLQLGDSISLDHGVAFTAPSFANFVEANQFREVAVADAASFSIAFEIVRDHFAELGLTCGVWAPAMGQPIEPFDAFLPAKGYTRRDISAMVVRQWVDLPGSDEIRVLPARAMPKALRAVLEQAYAHLDEPQRKHAIEATSERLDDPHTDGFVATLDGQPAGFCIHFSVGDIGRITDLYVVSQMRRRGVGSNLLGAALRLARRLVMRVTALQVEKPNEAMIALCNKSGLEEDGSIVEYVLKPEAS